MAIIGAKQAGLLLAAIAVAAGAGYEGGLLLVGNLESARTETAEQGTNGPFFVDAGQLVIPIMEGGKTKAFILSKITLEAPDAANADRLRRELPRARNTLLQGLFQLAGDGVFDAREIDPGAVADTLRRTLSERMGEGTVRAVLMDRLMRQENTRA